MLVIHLQDGFREDTVIIQANGTEVYRGENVSESLLTGFTDVSLELEVPDGLVEVEVELPTRGLTAVDSVNPAEFPYLGVAVVNNQIEFRRLAREFGYQ